MILLFVSCFIINCCGTLIFSQISDLFICAIFEHNNFEAAKEIHYFWFFILNNKCRYQVPVITQNNNWNTEQYCGLANCCEEDLESDIYCLDSVNLWQYTTVLCQCERLPWTWTWFLLYFEHLSLFEKQPVSVSLLCASNYHDNKVTVCDVFPQFSNYCYGELSILFLFILPWDTPV